MITAILSSLLGLLYVKISFAVIQQRRSKKILYGVGKKGEIEAWVGAHANFAAYVPIMLILFYFIEKALIIHWTILILLALSIIAGRYVHFEGMIDDNKRHLRVRGMKLTFFPIIIMSVVNIILAVVYRIGYL